jgi:hypothetical protein
VVLADVDALSLRTTRFYLSPLTRDRGPARLIEQTDHLVNNPPQWCDGPNHVNGHEVSHTRARFAVFDTPKLVVESDEDRGVGWRLIDRDSLATSEASGASRPGINTSAGLAMTTASG